MTIEKQLKIIRPFAGLLILISLFSSCYVETEGCLDVQSANYDLSADIPCEDCCSYPSLTLWVSHQTNEELLSFDSIYFNDLGQEYQFIDYKLVLSNFSFTDDQLTTYRALDSTEVIGNDPSNIFYLKDDIAVVSRSDIQYGLGSFNASGSLESFSFDLGLDPEKRDIDLTSLPAGHPLNDSLLIDDAGDLMNGYITLTDLATSDTLVIQLQKDLSNQSLNYDIQSEVNPGFSIEINLIIDYLFLLFTADIQNDSNETICNKMLLNLPTSFILQ